VKGSVLAVTVTASSGSRQNNTAAFRSKTLPPVELFFAYQVLTKVRQLIY